jgi:hypothetical protein
LQHPGGGSGTGISALRTPGRRDGAAVPVAVADRRYGRAS